MYVQIVIGWFIKLVVAVAVIAVVAWILTNPATAANFVVSIVSGVKIFVQTIITGISKLLG